MSKHNDTDSLEAVIEGLDEVIEVYSKTQGMQSPKHIDERIRAAAHAAVAGPKGSKPLPFGWLVPVTLAAAVLIAVGVVNLYPGSFFGDDTGQPPKVADAKTADRQATKTARAYTRSTPGSKPTNNQTIVATADNDQLSFDHPVHGRYTALEERYRNDPKAWLKVIETLKRTGKTDEARDELAAFRQAFPNHKVPRRLRKLLKNN